MANFPEHFKQQYKSHLRHLKLKGLQPKTIDAYARGMRRIGEYFAYQVDGLSQDQLTEYFTDLLDSHSWSGVKLDLYGLKFFTEHVLRKPWEMRNFIRPPKVSRLPDIVSVQEAQALFDATRVLSYRVFFFTLYSLGEGLALTVGDINGARLRVHVRDAKGNRDRLVPLPQQTPCRVSACTPPCAAAPMTARRWSSFAATSRGRPWPTNACSATPPGRSC